MKRLPPVKRPRYLRWALGLIAFMGLMGLGRGADPRIDFISNIVARPIVEIHFSTPTDTTSHKYFVQYINSLPCATNHPTCNTNMLTLTNWSNLYTGYSFPFPYHYVVPDTRTNRSRFYRLLVTP